MATDLEKTAIDVIQAATTRLSVTQTLAILSGSLVLAAKKRGGTKEQVQKFIEERFEEYEDTFDARSPH